MSYNNGGLDAKALNLVPMVVEQSSRGERAYDIYYKSAIFCIQWSTSNRNNWEYITENRKYKIFSAFSYLCFDPHLWRRFSSIYSPKISENQKKQLSKITLKSESVAKFISESLEYAK